ncbi:uncharacterized protein [Notamacropus eugenii]|uniref:uncharacterized protein n=1 Tax=Notamacropus eugenii TaxID=9315 RepID=UPI003B6766BA
MQPERRLGGEGGAGGKGRVSRSPTSYRGHVPPTSLPPHPRASGSPATGDVSRRPRGGGGVGMESRRVLALPRPDTMGHSNGVGGCPRRKGRASSLTTPPLFGPAHPTSPSAEGGRPHVCYAAGEASSRSLPFTPRGGSLPAGSRGEEERLLPLPMGGLQTFGGSDKASPPRILVRSGPASLALLRGRAPSRRTALQRPHPPGGRTPQAWPLPPLRVPSPSLLPNSPSSESREIVSSLERLGDLVKSSNRAPHPSQILRISYPAMNLVKTLQRKKEH